VCTDTDECAAGVAACHADARCVNRPGGYDCLCNPGHAGDGLACADIDECASGIDNCSDHARCQNTPGGFQCTCLDGFEGDGVTCVDIDECVAGRETSHIRTRAVLAREDRLVGPFDPADPEGTSSLRTSLSVFDSTGREYSMGLAFGRIGPGHWAVAATLPGESIQRVNPDQLYRIDVGRLEFDPMGRLARTVVSTPIQVDWMNGTPGQIRFDFGTPLAADGDGLDGVIESAVVPESRLVDVTQDGTAIRGGCSEHGECVNTLGGHGCVCWSGFLGDGIECVDIDECDAGDDNCSEHATCSNAAGGFTCNCLPGYTGTGVQCRDRDECLHSEDDCAAQARCINTAGSYTCLCNEGYTGTGQSCQDIDECAEEISPCPQGRRCTNLVGSFICDPI